MTTKRHAKMTEIPLDTDYHFSELFVKRERLTELGGTYETNIVTVYP